MKTCSKCDKPKPLSGFYSNSRYSDGYQGVCRTCQNKRMRELEQTPERKAIVKKYRQSEKGKKVRCANAARYRARHPEKIAAHIAARDIERQPCEICGTIENIHAHHDDYSKPLDVRFLCREHHDEHHNGG